jgi:hypothetical protein
VPHPESIILTFSHTRKAADTLIFTIGYKSVFSACQYLVSVSLMAYIPNYLVIGRIIDIVERNRQLNNTEACSEMAGIGAYFVNDKLPEFIADPDQIQLIQFPEIFRSVNFIKQPLFLPGISEVS